MSNDQATPIKKRMRSPAYPATDLKEALDRAGVIWKNDRNHETQLKSLSAHWGFNPQSSSVLSKVASLKHFGLLDEIKGGSPGAVKLSDLAIKILTNEDPNSPERIALIKKSALMPDVYSELWAKYNGELPSDVTIKAYLSGDRAFNPDVVNGLLKDFRSTISFAKLDSSDTVIKEDSTEQPNAMPQPKITLPIPNRSTEPLVQFVHPKPVDQPSDITASPAVARHIQNPSELSLPLESGRAVIVPRMTKDDFDLFLETLKLWERRIVIKQTDPGIKFPAQALWKNKDFDKPVTIVGVAGQMNGEIFYQSEDGTGIPAKELVFS